MMRLVCSILICIIAVSSVFGLDQRLELSMKPYEHSGNIFKDSSEISDVTSSVKASYKLYLIDNIEFNGFAQRQNYDRNSRLSSWQYGGGLSAIPLSDSSRFQLYTSFNFYKYEYSKEITITSTEFQTDYMESRITGGYSLTDNLYGRFGYRNGFTGYEKDQLATKKEHILFSGFNLTLFNRFGIDIEGGTIWGNLQYVPRSIGGIQDSVKAYSVLADGDIRSHYLSVRLSHQLGSKTGLAQTISYRSFSTLPDSAVLFGYSSGYLSPWVDTYEGTAYQVKLKTFLIPRFILTAGFAYLDKQFLPVVERIKISDPFLGDVYLTTTVRSQERSDISRKLLFSMTYPIANDLGFLIEPEFNIEFTNNSSTVDVYRYSDYNYSVSLKITY